MHSKCIFVFEILHSQKKKSWNSHLLCTNYGSKSDTMYTTVTLSVCNTTAIYKIFNLKGNDLYIKYDNFGLHLTKRSFFGYLLGLLQIRFGLSEWQNQLHLVWNLFRALNNLHILGLWTKFAPYTKALSHITCFIRADFLSIFIRCLPSVAWSHQDEEMHRWESSFLWMGHLPLRPCFGLSLHL